LYNSNTLQINALVKVQSIILESDVIVFGIAASNTYGTLATVKDFLEIKSKTTIDARYGKIYGSTRLIIETVGNITTGELVKLSQTSYISNSSYIASNGPIIIKCDSLNISYGQITTSSTLLI